MTTNPSGLVAGTYRSVITLQSGNLALSVPVELIVAETPQDFDLSFSGLTFRSAADVPPAPQQLLLINRAVSPLDWMAASGSRIHPEPASGVTDTSTAITLNIDTGRVSPGLYQGNLAVQPKSGGKEQMVNISVQVTSGAASPTVAPSGIIFRSPRGEKPERQKISIHNSSGTEVTFVSSSGAPNSPGWLFYTPSTGAIQPGRTIEIEVEVSRDQVVPGTHRASIAFEFSDGSVGAVEIALIAAGSACEPTRLVPIITRTVQNFRAVQGQPEAIEVLVSDDCGNPVPQGIGLVWFSDASEPAAPLIGAGNGMFTSTWTPKATHSSLTLNVTFTAGGQQSGLSGSTETTGAVLEPPPAPKPQE